MAKVKIDIEDLVAWAVGQQSADVSRGDAMSQEMRHLTGGRVSPTGAVEAFMELGTYVDGGGHSRNKVPVDANKVAAAIDRLPIEAAALIVVAGRTGQPFDWAEEGLGQWMPVLDKHGKQQKLWQDAKRQRGLLGWGYKFEGHGPDDLDFIRVQYWAWWHALTELKGMLEGQLTKWEVTGPRRSAEPWNDAPRVIHHGHFESIDVG